MGAKMNVDARFGVLLMYAAIGALVCCNQPALADVTCPPNDPFGCKQSESGIGEAYSEMRGVHRRSLMSKENNLGGIATQEATDVTVGRQLLQSGCSTTDGSPQAVAQCTNAVRANPESYKHLYSCDHSWLGTYVGKYRRPLSIHPNLNNAAQSHSQDQATMSRMTHTGSNGSNIGQRAKGSGYSYRGIAENVAFGHRSAASVVGAWMCSSGHRKNIMNCQYSDMGNGAAQGSNGRTYHTQVFGCQGNSCSCSSSPTQSFNPTPAPVATPGPSPIIPGSSPIIPGPSPIIPGPSPIIPAPSPRRTRTRTPVPGPQPTTNPTAPNPFHSGNTRTKRGGGFDFPFNFQPFQSPFLAPLGSSPYGTQSTVAPLGSSPYDTSSTVPAASTQSAPAGGLNPTMARLCQNARRKPDFCI